MADNPNIKVIDVINKLIDFKLDTVYTALPGHVLSFDNETQLAQIQIDVLAQDGDGKDYVPAPISDVPLQVYGSAYVVECAIEPGCEGLLCFSKKCIDGWITTGGVAVNPIQNRAFCVSDAFFIPGLRSMPGAVPAHKNEGIRLRNQDGSQFVWLHENGDIDVANSAASVAIKASGDVAISGVQITIKGSMINLNGATIDPSGRLIATESTAGGIAFSTHRHGGVQGGPSSTGTPQ